ncbi:MAG: prolyl oligopeptidase family serine peptidase [Bacteroidales bacterium]
MKRITLLSLFMAISLLTFAQKPITQWLHAGPFPLHLPVFAEAGTIENEPIELGDAMTQMAPLAGTLQANQNLTLFQSTNKITSVQIPADTVIAPATTAPKMHWLSSHVATDRWMQVPLTIKTNGIFEIYLNGEKFHTQKTVSSEVKKTLTLQQGVHEIRIRLIQQGQEDPLRLWAELAPKEEIQQALQANLLSPNQYLTIQHILDGKSIKGFAVSPSGKYFFMKEETSYPGGKNTTSRIVVKRMKDASVVYQFRDSDINQLKWLPTTDKLSYTAKTEKHTNVYTLNLATMQETLIAEQLADFGSYQWSPKEDFIIFSVYKTADKPNGLKRIFGNEDRLPYFRNRSYLHLLDCTSGQTFPLTSGNLSAQLHDIHPSGKKILFSTSHASYQEIPFSKQALYELTLANFSVDTLWKDKLYSGYASYSPDGGNLLVQGGPLCFGKIGVNVSDNRFPNNYDSQLYLYNPENGEVKPLTKSFAPSINSAYWLNNDEMYLSVAERDETNLYKYNFKSEEFEQIPLETEVLSRIAFNKEGDVALYNGTSITTPNKLFSLNTKKATSSLIAYPQQEELKNVQYGKTEDCNFTNSRGDEISGRVYYPPNYDATKKYPVIVYYYGGTSPVERSFGGRYPKNVWAAHGYMVYVLQPSGTIGFGQDFSALHVNGWGKEAIDDIIEGTQAFLQKHPSADADNMGCIGASYGGFTTMLLQTRTDLFKTAISHAGISSISSYWGEGYWGYTYSAVASAHAFPWNRKDVYVENSPLFNADKFSNSILLLHGTADTNVPVGESLQYYAALKILGKDVEMVLVDDEDHWIIDYEKRIKWHNTIVSWFDYKLKEQDEQWNELYPEKNLN